MADNAASGLAACRVVVIRPEPQASKMVQALMAAGAQAQAIPLLKISGRSAITTANQYRAQLSALDVPTKVVYVSAAAVKYGVPIIRELTLFSAHAQNIAIGAATANHLTKLGETCFIEPTQDEDSESLLADPAFKNIAGQTIVLMSGESEAGGRKLLADTLMKRGATVVKIVCYKREAIKLSDTDKLTLHASIANATHVVAGSIETLDALAVNGDQLIQRIQYLLVPHARIAAMAKARGVARVSVLSFDDNKFIAALAEI